MREAGLWKKKPEQPPSDGIIECDLRNDLVWIAVAFFDLSKKRNWISTGFGTRPATIETSKIREHYFDELGLTDGALYKIFRRLIDRLDTDWCEDWLRREEKRRQDEQSKVNHRTRRTGK